MDIYEVQSYRAYMLKNIPEEMSLFINDEIFPSEDELINALRYVNKHDTVNIVLIVTQLLFKNLYILCGYDQVKANQEASSFVMSKEFYVTIKCEIAKLKEWNNTT